MSLRNPRALFGVHSFSPYSRETGEFYGTIKTLSGSSMSLSGDQVKLEGGSNKYSWAVESGKVSAELSLKFSEYPAFLFELFLGQKATETTTPATAGEVTTAKNKKGASIVSATAGVSAVAVIPSTGPANLKFGRYVLKALTSTKLAVLVSTDIDFARGSAGDYSSDLLQVAEVTVAAGANDLAHYGLRLTGIGIPDFVLGDTAEFDVLPPYSEKVEVVVGAAGVSAPEFGAIVMAEKRSDSSITAVDCFRLKGLGLPLSFESGAFSQSEVKLEAMYDAEKNGVFKFINLKEI